MNGRACRTAAGKRKVRYVREGSAWSDAVMMTMRHGEKFQAYVCGYCRFWHIGRPKPPRVFISRDEALDLPRTVERLEAKDRRRHLVAMAAMQPRRLP